MHCQISAREQMFRFIDNHHGELDRDYVHTRRPDKRKKNKKNILMMTSYSKRQSIPTPT